MGSPDHENAVESNSTDRIRDRTSGRARRLPAALVRHDDPRRDSHGNHPTVVLAHPH